MSVKEEVNWFESWFDSPYYHLLYKNRDESEAAQFLNGLMQQLSLPARVKFWDMACGKGRHVLYLLEKGFDAIGSDLSKNSISTATKDTSNLSLDSIPFFVHDMRQPLLLNHFDVVLNVFTSIGYFENSTDNQRVFAAAFDALKRDGCFVVDFMNVSKIKNNLLAAEGKKMGEVHFKISRCIEGNRIIKKIHVEDCGKKMEFQERVELLYEADFLRLANAAGFEFEEKFGNYLLEPFNEEISDRLIMIFRKKK
jgi:SAM-dependent methyltransferase